jgi:DNA-binding NarL/FixJ family response regulator
VLISKHLESFALRPEYHLLKPWREKIKKRTKKDFVHNSRLLGLSDVHWIGSTLGNDEVECQGTKVPIGPAHFAVLSSGQFESNTHMTLGISVVVGTDLPQTSRFVSASFKRSSDIRLAGVATDDAGVLHLGRVHTPHIAIVNLRISQSALATLISNLADSGISPVVMSDEVDDAEGVELLQYGLVGILPTSLTAEMLCRSVRAIASGEFWIRRKTIGILIDHLRGASNLASDFRPHPAKDTYRPKPQSDNQFSLTQRELQIVHATTEGLTNKEIASALGISEFTVKHHLAKIFDKVGVYSRLELATFAVHHNIHRYSVAPQLAGTLHSTAAARTGTF